jgi:hypothetical protein
LYSLGVTWSRWRLFCFQQGQEEYLEVDQSSELMRAGQVLITGYIYPGWLLARPILGIEEQDEAGCYFISNEGLGLYAVGFTQEQALADFRQTFISNYQLLETQANENSDLQVLFQEYRKYLKSPSKDS